jgi:hypothetical protein
LSVRVDHRSNKDRGIEAEPTIHVGPTATTMERDGERSNRGDINRAIQERNQRRRSAARELAEAEAEYKTAQRRSQQAREQAKRQQAPGPVPAHGSAAVDQAPDRSARTADLANRLMGTDAIAAQVAGIGVTPADPDRLARWRAKREAEKVDQRQREEAQRKQQQEQAARDRALAGLAKFRRIAGERASEITVQAAERAEQLQAEQRRVWQQQRELAEVKPREPGAVARWLGGGARYRRDLDAWQGQAGDLHEADQRLRLGIEAERRDHASAGETAARELARRNPDLVRLAEAGMVIEQRERQEQEAERQRQREAKRQERAKAERVRRIMQAAEQKARQALRQGREAPTTEQVKDDVKARLEVERKQAQEQTQDRPRRKPRGPSMGM